MRTQFTPRALALSTFALVALSAGYARAESSQTDTSGSTTVQSGSLDSSGSSHHSGSTKSQTNHRSGKKLVPAAKAGSRGSLGSGGPQASRGTSGAGVPSATQTGSEGDDQDMNSHGSPDNTGPESDGSGSRM
ncbi:MAG: hypothetical protein U0136_10895 [Bdellovibrionota bacterium]